MNRLILYLSSAFVLISTFNVVKAQTYTIQSFDGGKANINLNDRLCNKQLIISYLNDTVHVVEYTGELQGHIVNDKFLQITYETRGGTGSQDKSTLYYP